MRNLILFILLTLPIVGCSDFEGVYTKEMSYEGPDELKKKRISEAINHLVSLFEENSFSCMVKVNTPYAGCDLKTDEYALSIVSTSVMINTYKFEDAIKIRLSVRSYTFHPFDSVHEHFYEMVKVMDKVVGDYPDFKVF